MQKDKFENHRNQFPTFNSINFRKSKYDSFSYVGFLCIIATVYYLLFDRDDFLNNMEEPINFTCWILIMSYPLIRYFIPFHVYQLDSHGITLKKGAFLKWNDIKTINIYDNYEEVKDEDIYSYKLEINIIKLDNSESKIDLRNYTIAEPELKAKLKPFFNKDFKMRDALVKIFEAFYEKHRTTSQQNR